MRISGKNSASAESNISSEGLLIKATKERFSHGKHKFELAASGKAGKAPDC